MTRHPDWERRLNRAVQKHAEMDGQWGKSDCWSLGCDAFRAVTGRALLPHLRRYYSEKSGYRLFRKHGFETVGEALASVLPVRSRLSAMRGDLATIMREGVESCGAVTSLGLAVKTIYGDPETATITRAAVEYFPVTDIHRAFRVE